MELSERQKSLCSESRWDFSEPCALFAHQEPVDDLPRDEWREDG
jgi:hypothetical protein